MAKKSVTKRKTRRSTVKSRKRSGRKRPDKALCILVTGFGPFPGAPVNPTGALIAALARKLRSASGPIHIATHVFPTTYAAVDRDLPRLLARTKPHVLLMFGLATRSRGIRVETRARNRICNGPDAAGITPQTRMIAAGAPPTMPIRAPQAALLRAAKSGALPARLSINAGDYLCNYLYWRALEAVRRGSGPSRAAFIHVPPLDIKTSGGSARTLGNLVVCAEAIAAAMIRALRTRR